MEMKQQNVSDPFFVDENKTEEAFLVYLFEAYQQFLSGEDSFYAAQNALEEKFGMCLLTLWLT